MPPAGFEPAIPGNQRPQTQALDREANGIGTTIHLYRVFQICIVCFVASLSCVVCDCCSLAVCIVVVVLYMCCYLMCICCTFFFLLKTPDCWLEVSIRKVLRPATSAQVFLSYPVPKSKC